MFINIVKEQWESARGISQKEDISFHIPGNYVTIAYKGHGTIFYLPVVLYLGYWLDACQLSILLGTGRGIMCMSIAIVSVSIR